MERRRLEAVAAVSFFWGAQAASLLHSAAGRMRQSIGQLRFPLREDIKKTRPNAASTVATTKLAVEISKRP
jgi:hypothetical protein